MVSAVLVLLAADPEMTQRLLSPVLFTIVVAIIIGREITISALREWMAELGNRGVVAVGWLGKIKTTLQFIAITVLLFAQAGMQGGVTWSFCVTVITPPMKC